MIDREQARAIAEAEAKRCRYGAGVSRVISGEKAANLGGVYLSGEDADARENCWFAYIDLEELRVGATPILAVSKEDGRIVGVGSEGE